MEVTVNISGLRELEDALASLGPKLAKKALVAGLRAGAAPMVEAAKAKAPLLAVATKNRAIGELRDSIGVTTKLKGERATAKIGPKRVKGGGQEDPGCWGLIEEFG